MRATQFSLYSLFSYFIASGSKSISLALHHAVINGDDLAVALLLKLNSDAERAALKLLPSVDRHEIVLRADQYLEHYQSAVNLKFYVIAHRINIALVHHVNYILRKYSLTNFSPTKLSPAVIALVHHYIHEHFQPGIPFSPSESVDVIEENLELYYQYLYEIQNSQIPDLETLLKSIPLHNAFLPMKANVTLEKKECAADLSTDGDAINICQDEVKNSDEMEGYVVRNVPVVDSGPTGEAKGVASTTSCDIDVVDIDSLSPQDFYRKYVVLNKPVVLQLPQSILSHADVLQGKHANCS